MKVGKLKDINPFKIYNVTKNTRRVLIARLIEINENVYQEQLENGIVILIPESILKKENRVKGDIISESCEVIINKDNPKKRLITLSQLANFGDSNKVYQTQDDDKIIYLIPEKIYNKTTK